MWAHATGAYGGGRKEGVGAGRRTETKEGNKIRGFEKVRKTVKKVNTKINWEVGRYQEFEKKRNTIDT